MIDRHDGTRGVRARSVGSTPSKAAGRYGSNTPASTAPGSRLSSTPNSTSPSGFPALRIARFTSCPASPAGTICSVMPLERSNPSTTVRTHVERVVGQQRHRDRRVGVVAAGVARRMPTRISDTIDDRRRREVRARPFMTVSPGRIASTAPDRTSIEARLAGELVADAQARAGLQVRVRPAASAIPSFARRAPDPPTANRLIGLAGPALQRTLAMDRVRLRVPEDRIEPDPGESRRDHDQRVARAVGRAGRRRRRRSPLARRPPGARRVSARSRSVASLSRGCCCIRPPSRSIALARRGRHRVHVAHQQRRRRSPDDAPRRPAVGGDTSGSSRTGTSGSRRSAAAEHQRRSHDGLPPPALPGSGSSGRRRLKPASQPGCPSSPLWSGRQYRRLPSGQLLGPIAMTCRRRPSIARPMSTRMIGR